MNCCIECFQDTQIQTMIEKNDKKGSCSFCGKENVLVYPVDTQSDLSELISAVLSLYEEAEDGELLFEMIVNDWGIFEKSIDSSTDLLAAFCMTIFGDDGYSHNTKARIPHDYVEQYGIFSGHSWAEFADVIKTKNRFYNSYFKADQFISFLSYSITKYSKGTKFYRARICNDQKGYSKEEMGAPPVRKRKPGRVNPEGIGVLYLASDEQTALNEVRASAFDYVTVGTFELVKEINVVNISGLNSISPMLCQSGLEPLAANIKIFSDIAKEMAKPLRRSDSPLEYLPTQYITEFIKSKGYYGVMYKSTMGTGGDDIAVFDEALFKCIAVHDVEIKEVMYNYAECLLER